jgi:hypothetical protein
MKFIQFAMLSVLALAAPSVKQAEGNIQKRDPYGKPSTTTPCASTASATAAPYGSAGGSSGITAADLTKGTSERFKFFNTFVAKNYLEQVKNNRADLWFKEFCTVIDTIKANAEQRLKTKAPKY